MTIKQAVKHLILFAVGALIYGIIEILASGNTHWSMLILGGICFLLIGVLNEKSPYDLSITTQMLIGAVIITLLEFLVGCIVNIWLGWNVWDYSNDPYNLFGQICAKNSFYWFLLSAAAIFIDDKIRQYLFGEKEQKYHL